MLAYFHLKFCFSMGISLAEHLAEFHEKVAKSSKNRKNDLFCYSMCTYTWNVSNRKYILFFEWARREFSTF